jgi:hypothetical protein
VSRIEWLTHEHFAGRVGERFTLVLPEGSPLELVLVETAVSEELGGQGPEGEERHQFSVVFRGPASPVLAQSIYGLHHAELGELELFLVPLGPDGEGIRYEAAFA